MPNGSVKIQCPTCKSKLWLSFITNINEDGQYYLIVCAECQKCGDEVNISKWSKRQFDLARIKSITKLETKENIVECFIK